MRQDKRVLNEDELEWVKKQIHHFDSNIKNNPDISHHHVKEAFDAYFDGIYALYQKYETKHLLQFCIKGYEYEGFMPGNNANFLALFEELIDMMRDLEISKPITYLSVVDESLVLIEESEEGLKRIIKTFSYATE